MVKIAIIGAGSAVFSQRLITDILSIDGLQGGVFALVDIDTERLEIAHQLAELTVRRSGKSWTIEATTDRTTVLNDCDYILNMIEVAGLQNVRSDYDIPLKYGIDQCIGDTIGPGGIFKFFRTAPTWLEILKDIETRCPNALVMNYSNPMSALVLAAGRSVSLKVIGLCHSVQHTSRNLAEYMNIPYEKLHYTCGGINHLAWFTRLETDGKDVYPHLLEVARKNEIYENDPVRFEMLFHFGAFVTESSGHFSEYVPYFRKRKELVSQYMRSGYRGESGYYANNWPTWRANHDNKARQMIADELADKEAIVIKRSVEYGADIIESHELNRLHVIYGNVMNTGLITNLAGDGCVEVACLVDRNGIQPTHFGTLPSQLAALDQAHMFVHDLMVESLLNQNREAAVHALLLDPLTATILPPSEIRQLFDEMVVDQVDYLPAYMSQ